MPGPLRLVGTFALKFAFELSRGMQMLEARVLERTDRIELGSWLLGLLALCFMTLVLSGCNTARGVGEDVSAAGDAISEPFEDQDEDQEPGA